MMRQGGVGGCVWRRWGPSPSSNSPTRPKIPRRRLSQLFCRPYSSAMRERFCTARRERFWSQQPTPMHCMHCGNVVERGSHHRNERRATIEHIIPKSRGGTDAPKNLGVACLRCNTHRGSALDWKQNNKPDSPVSLIHSDIIDMSKPPREPHTKIPHKGSSLQYNDLA